MIYRLLLHKSVTKFLEKKIIVLVVIYSRAWFEMTALFIVNLYLPKIISNEL